MFASTERASTGLSGVGTVILAAGPSTRMGISKQLLEFGGQSLLRRAASAALEACCTPVVVVMGANAAASSENLRGLDINVAENHDWQSGMSSSVRVGVDAIASNPKIEAVVLMLCDQPFVTEDVILELVRAYREKKCSIVASRYAEGYGVPALFDRMHFAELMALEGEAGAKRVIERHLRNVHLLSFPEGKIDIDTPEDFARLQSKSPGS